MTNAMTIECQVQERAMHVPGAVREPGGGHLVLWTGRQAETGPGTSVGTPRRHNTRTRPGPHTRASVQPHEAIKYGSNIKYGSITTLVQLPVQLRNLLNASN